MQNMVSWESQGISQNTADDAKDNVKHDDDCSYTWKDSGGDEDDGIGINE